MSLMPQRYPLAEGIQFDNPGKIYVAGVLVATIDSNGLLKIKSDIMTNQSL